MKERILNPAKKPLTIGLAGDVMLGRLVDEWIGVGDGRYRQIWGDVLTLLKDTDVNLINLETTLTNSTAAVPKMFNFKAAPDRVKALQEAHITVVNLANNHIFDFGKEGLQETIATLQQAGIKYVGAGTTRKKAHAPVILTLHSTNVGILGFQDNEPDWEATATKEGTAYIKVGDENYERAVEQEVRKLKPKVDLCIVSLHWGPNMRQYPSAEFRAFAHKLVDAGADIIHGHSAHLFQGIELYYEKVIIYDCGDFMDDYAVDPMRRNDRSFYFKAIVSSRGIEAVQLFPVLIEHMQVNISQGKDRAQTIERMKELSRELGTTLQDTPFGLEVRVR